jgi:membrane protein YqaA with SNARE-associated domain
MSFWEKRKSTLNRIFQGRGEPDDSSRPAKKRKYLVPLLTIPPLITIMVVLFIYRDWLAELGNWGYLGAFLIGLIGNATVVLPMPSLVLLFALGASFNPFLVGLLGAAGGAIGELSGYFLGYSGTAFIRNTRLYLQAENWMKKLGSVAIFLFALVPFLHFDLAGIASGVLRFPIWKFLIACWLGKAILYIGLAYASLWGWDFIQRFF